jgi:hypothetical protein
MTKAVEGVPRVGGASAAMGSSIAAAFNLPRWRRATGCLGCASTSKWEG